MSRLASKAELQSIWNLNVRKTRCQPDAFRKQRKLFDAVYSYEITWEFILTHCHMMITHNYTYIKSLYVMYNNTIPCLCYNVWHKQWDDTILAQQGMWHASSCCICFTSIFKAQVTNLRTLCYVFYATQFNYANLIKTEYPTAVATTCNFSRNMI